jgi:hypothetical protein
MFQCLRGCLQQRAALVSLEVAFTQTYPCHLYTSQIITLATTPTTFTHIGRLIQLLNHLAS